MNDVADKKWGSLKNENTLKYDTSQPKLGNRSTRDEHSFIVLQFGPPKKICLFLREWPAMLDSWTEYAVLLKASFGFIWDILNFLKICKSWAWAQIRRSKLLLWGWIRFSRSLPLSNNYSCNITCLVFAPAKSFSHSTNRSLK